METKKKREKNGLIQMVIPVTVFLCFILGTLLVYSNKLDEISDKTIDAQGKELLRLYAAKLSGELLRLEASAEPVTDIVAEYPETTEAVLTSLTDNTSADRAALFDMDGNGVDAQGNSVFMDPALYRDETKLGKCTYHYYGNGVITVLKPVVQEQGAVKRILCLEYEVSKLKDQFINFDFGRQTWVALVDDKGTVIYSFGGEKAEYITDDADFFELLQSAEGNGKVLMRDDISRQAAGRVNLTFDGEERTVFYKGLGINNWYVVMGVPVSYMESRASAAYLATDEMAKWIIAGMFVFVAIVIFITIMDRITGKIKSRNLIQLAETDQLTGLYNKVTTEKKIKEYLTENPESQSVLFVLDIDNFKKINDTMGHAFGDEVLRNVGQRIRMEFRASDIIGRAGGDEFIILLKDLKDEKFIIREAQKVEHFFQNFQVGNYVKYSATASIGCAVFSRDGKDFEELYKAADQALYKAKHRGKNQLAFYKDPEGFGQSV